MRELRELGKLREKVFSNYKHKKYRRSKVVYS